MTAPLRLHGAGRGPSRSRGGAEGVRTCRPPPPAAGRARSRPPRRAAPRGRRLCLVMLRLARPTPRSHKRLPSPGAPGSIERYRAALAHRQVPAPGMLGSSGPKVPAPGILGSIRPTSRFLHQGHQVVSSDIKQHWPTGKSLPQGCWAALVPQVPAPQAGSFPRDTRQHQAISCSMLSPPKLAQLPSSQAPSPLRVCSTEHRWRLSWLGWRSCCTIPSGLQDIRWVCPPKATLGSPALGLPGLGGVRVSCHQGGMVAESGQRRAQVAAVPALGLVSSYSRRPRALELLSQEGPWGRTAILC